MSDKENIIKADVLLHSVEADLIRINDKIKEARFILGKTDAIKNG